MLIFDVPFAIAAEFEPALTGANTPLPYKTLDVTPSMLIEAMFPAPDTFAKATAFAVAAFVTSPVTLAPAIAESPDPIPVIMPVAFNVPATLAPVVVTINTSAVPPTPTVTFPSVVGISTLDVPSTILVADPAGKFVKFAPSPEKYAATTAVVAFTFPASKFPVTFALVRFPTEVMFA